MKNLPLVSVIIPSYNQAQYLGEALDSLLAQTYPDWEAVIVDDGSPDNVAEIAAEYTLKDSRIKFFHTENNGVSAARNFGVAQSSGEFILPLDADDKIDSTYIEKAINYFINNPSTDIVYCDWKYFGTETVAPPLKYSGYKNLLLQNSIFNGAVYRRKDFDRIGGYDENLKGALEDWEFLLRLLNPQSIVYQIPEKLFYYRIRESSRNNTTKDNIKFQHLIYRKHADLYDQHYGYPIKIILEREEWKRRYYNVWYKKLWYKYIVRKHLEYFD